MVNALIDARYVWQYMTYAHVVSFDWWSCVSTLPHARPRSTARSAIPLSMQATATILLSFTLTPTNNQTQDYTFYTTKRTYMMKHFAYFPSPPAVCATTYLSPSSRTRSISSPAS
ncbi:hypothetical protein MRB53_040501 [Persea americana]|nr:hypothetical protein MRB53_040501 [Persea americana]